MDLACSSRSPPPRRRRRRPTTQLLRIKRTLKINVHLILLPKLFFYFNKVVFLA